MGVVSVLALMVCLALGASNQECILGPWSEWSDCKRDEVCDTQSVPQSYDMSDKEKELGRGRQVMKQMMNLKTKLYEDKKACIASGNCPERMEKDSVIGQRQECVDGVSNGYPCNKVDLLSFLNHSDLGFSGAQGNDMWVWHDGTDNYVIMGHTEGSSFVRVTDPINPEPLGVLPTHTSNSIWRDMKVIGDFAYIVSEATDHGMQIFDLTKLRGLTFNSSRVFEADAHYNKVSNSHNIAANPDSNTLFLIGNTLDTGSDVEVCDGGLHMVDVSDPLNPVFSGCYGGDGYVHDTQCIIYHGPDMGYQGREICFCYNEDSFTIVDVTERQSPNMLSRETYEGVEYTHQGWVTEDRKFAVMNDEWDEQRGESGFTKTFVWNITSLEKPNLVNRFVSTETATDHNLYIEGNWVHQSNYEAGYRLLELNDVTGGLTERAYFDVFPSETTVTFGGTWSNYPWLKDKDGVSYVALSSIEYGLYLLQPQWDAIDQESVTLGYRTRKRDITHIKSTAKCPDMEEKEACHASLC